LLAEGGSLAAGRWVDLAGAFNVRDIGGLPAGARMTATNVLYRGDSLDELTPDDLVKLSERGVRTVIDLRSDLEHTGAPDWMARSGVEYRHLPLFDLTGEAAAGFRTNIVSNVSAAYREMLVLAAPAIAVVAGVIADRHSDGVTVVHCAAGKDRTGIVIATLLLAVGVQPDSVISDYLATGEKLTLVRAALARRGVYGQQTLQLPPFDAEPIEAIVAVLQQEHGGADRFLLKAGLPAELLEALSHRLLAQSR
jgi:protein-tyrosine phosphatase